MKLSNSLFHIPLVTTQKRLDCVEMLVLTQVPSSQEEETLCASCELRSWETYKFTISLLKVSISMNLVPSVYNE
jgi:hypothetical protein